MRRTIAAVLIFAAALGFSACCEAYSLRVTQTLCSSAQAIKQQAQAGDFAAAEAALSQTEEYFSAHQAGLEVFSQRTGVSSIAVSLAGLRGFLNEENLPDLVSEADRFCAQVQAARHLFFVVF